MGKIWQKYLSSARTWTWMISSGKNYRALNKEVGGRCLVLDDGGTPSLKFRDQPRSDVTSDEAASAGHDPILAAGTDDRD